MTETPHLALPLIAAAQAQKHVTHNEALLAIDTLLQCAVLDKDLATPPAGPSEGDRYVVAASAAGDWVGNEDRIAVWQDGAWTYYAPQPGFIAFVVDESLLYFYGGSGWTSLASALNAVQNLSLLGLGTAADATNPFAAKLNKALWTATTAPEGGTGDLRYTLNKEAAGNVLSLLFQSGYSGRLELGLVGDDDVHLKVSADGSTWTEALRIDRATGGVDLLAAEASLAAATICDLGSSKTLKVTITGTTTITSFGTRANVLRLVCFADALALNHNATSLILPGAANIVTAAGDCAIATSDASGNWRVRGYMPATGKAVIKPASADISDATTTGKAALKAANAAALATAAGLGTANSPAFAGFSTTGVSQVRFDTGSLTDVFSIRNYGITSIGHGVCLALNIGALGGTQSYGGRLLAVASDTYATTANQTSYCQLQGILAGSIVTLMRWDPNPAASKVTSYYNFCPTTDNGLSLGIAGNRWSTVYAGTGTINTSDAREKTVVSALSEPELAAASDLAREIGTFQFLDAVAAKGADAARHHCGLTVQRAIEILTGHGLDPMRYAFICHDAWEATPEVPAVPPTPGIPAVPAILDADGCIVMPEVPAIPGDPGRPAEPAIPAGDRYGFRPDQLALFVARGQAARQDALEARIAALEPKAA